MDIRSFGQNLMSRIRQLPQGASGLAANLPEKAQAVLQDLPKNVEEGAKALLANEQVAEGWRTVAKGVGEMRGKVPADHVEISKPDVPEPKPSTKPAPLSDVVKKATKASKTTADKARTTKSATRVKQGTEVVRHSKPTPFEAKHLTTPQAFKAASKHVSENATLLKQTGNATEAKQLSELAKRLERAGELYKTGNKPAAFRMLHAKIKPGLANPSLENALRMGNKAEEVVAAFKQAPVAKPFAEASQNMLARAGELRATGHAAEARRLTTFANKLSKAGESYAQGNHQAAFKLFRKGMTAETQQALKMSGKAEEVLAAFSKQAKGAAKLAKGTETVAKVGRSAPGAARVAQGARKTKQAVQAAGDGVKVAKAVKGAAKEAAAVVKAAESGVASGVASNGLLGGIKNFFGKIGDSIKGLFGKASGTMSSGGWQTIKQGFGQMLPGIGKAVQSSAIFSAVISLGENLYLMLKGERSIGRAIGGVVGDTVAGMFGGVASALASGAAIAGLGALGVVGMPLTIAAAAIGILSFTVFDRFFRDTAIYDSLTHLFT